MIEVWKDVNGFESLYKVSSIGRVKSLERKVKHIIVGFQTIKCKILKQHLNRDGYYTVGLHKNGIAKTKQVHQLVAIAFYNHEPNGFTLVVNHKDLNKQNNNYKNLDVVTHRENSNRKHLSSTSVFTGVCWHKDHKKWHTKIGINGKTKHLGYFDNELEASEAYQKVLKRLQKTAI